MIAFELVAAKSVRDAIKAQVNAKSQSQPEIRFIAGGTNLVDYMKINVETPTRLIDINSLPLTSIETSTNGELRIGALARNSDVANHSVVKQRYPLLSEAILAGASPQLRNMATTGGNLLQRTRCVYYRDTSSPCNKREPGSGCSAIGGHNRMLAILGTSEQCIASNPSDQNVALMALEATVHVEGAKGKRAVPIGDFYVTPGATPQRETVLEPGDLITHVSLPAATTNARSLYLKLRDRASYEFALVSAAVVTRRDPAGSIDFVRIALGGVGTKPWRALEAEAALLGRAPSKSAFQAAADAALGDARPQTENGFKVELAKRCLVHALSKTTGAA